MNEHAPLLDDYLLAEIKSHLGAGVTAPELESVVSTSVRHSLKRLLENGKLNLDEEAAPHRYRFKVPYVAGPF